MNTTTRRASRRTLAAAILLLILTCVAGCRADDDKQAKLTIAGTYVDEFGTTQTITSSSWSDSYGNVFNIRTYSNLDQYVLAQNSASNTYNPSLYSRFDWTYSNSDLYYCQSVFDGATQADAYAGSADASDISGGCGGFSWTNLTP